MIPENFFVGAVGALMFGAIGIILFVISYVVFDFILKIVDFSEELNKGNISVAIVIAAMMLSIAIIISSVVH